MLGALSDAIHADAWGLDAVVIARHGAVVHERYYGDYAENIPHDLQSATKTVLSAVVGAALHQGCLTSVNDPIWDYLDVSRPQQHRNTGDVTLHHLLTMSSGLQWWGEISNGTPAILPGRGPDWAEQVASTPAIAEPGERWNYSAGDMQLLSAIITHSCGMSTADYAEKYLFEPLGMSGPYLWPADDQGVSWGYAGLQMTPRDMAKLGQLYLQDGVWHGQRLLPEGWVQQSWGRYFEIDVEDTSWGRHYGYTWWVDDDGPYYSARGYGGQFIWVIEEHDMVVVVTRSLGAALDAEWPQQLLRDYIVTAVVR